MGDVMCKSCYNKPAKDGDDFCVTCRNIIESFKLSGRNGNHKGSIKVKKLNFSVKYQGGRKL